MAVSFPAADSLDPTPTGMVHFANGEHHMFAHNETHGLHLLPVDTTTRGDGDVVQPCGNKDGDHHHQHPAEGFSKEEGKGFRLKRESEFVQDLEEVLQTNNGILGSSYLY